MTNKEKSHKRAHYNYNAPFFAAIKAKTALLSVAVSLFMTPPSGQAAELIESERGKLWISEWFSTSDAHWEISDSGIDPSIGFFEVRSRLDFDDTDSNISMAGGVLKIDDYFSISASYGFGDIDEGTVVDSDWISVPADSVYNQQISESLSKGTGDTSLVELGAHIRLSRPRSDERVSWYLGYFMYEDEIRMTEGVQTVSDTTYVSVPPAGTLFSDLNSTYDFRWEYLKFGIEWETSRKKRSGFAGGFHYLHLIEYRGEAFWNLRVGAPPDGFRSQPPNFIHKANSGSGYDAYLSVLFRISESSGITAGYRYFKIRAKNGTDTTFFADGSIATAALNTVEAERKGPYLSFEARF